MKQIRYTRSRVSPFRSTVWEVWMTEQYWNWRTTDVILLRGFRKHLLRLLLIEQYPLILHNVYFRSHCPFEDHQVPCNAVLRCMEVVMTSLTEQSSPYSRWHSLLFCVYIRFWKESSTTNKYNSHLDDDCSAAWYLHVHRSSAHSFIHWAGWTGMGISSFPSSVLSSWSTRLSCSL